MRTSKALRILSNVSEVNSGVTKEPSWSKDQYDVVHGNINNGGNGNFILNTREPDNEIFCIPPLRVVASPLQHGSNSQERPQTSDPSDVSISPGIEIETDAYNSENNETSDLNTPDHEETDNEEKVETANNKEVKENKRGKHKLGIRNMKKCEKTIRKMVENGSQRTKFLKEAGLKLPKTLKDMLVKLMARAYWDKEKCAKIQTVRAIHAGIELMEVPSNAKEFPDILDILALVLNIKTMKAVHTKKQTIKSFKEAGIRKRPLNEGEFQIPSCLTTLKKAKICAEEKVQNSYPSSPCPGSSESELPLI
ncbi:11344_t:CDS:10 [Funneliformis mosseae]|uniref:11344_t:CDS:1 n=1 Tax=Funneliformis mosseae TaxID=27381 RepID=A0A9N9BW70_FUNMO|nr:11344_t:CDS:10 [Funneliformis mosseae]